MTNNMVTEKMLDAAEKAIDELPFSALPYDTIHRTIAHAAISAALEQAAEAGITDDQVNAYKQTFQNYLETSKKAFGPKVAYEATRAGLMAVISLSQTAVKTQPQKIERMVIMFEKVVASRDSARAIAHSLRSELDAMRAAPVATREVTDAREAGIRLENALRNFTDGRDISYVDALAEARHVLGDASGSGVQECIAKLLWERFASEHETAWPTTHAAEYRLATEDIINLLGDKHALQAAIEVERGDHKFERIINDLNPEDALDDSLLRDIHLRLQIHGEKYPDRMVSVLHRNVVLYTITAAIRALLKEGEAAENFNAIPNFDRDPEIGGDHE